jgi:folate-binding protein YgfZ
VLTGERLAADAALHHAAVRIDRRTRRRLTFAGPKALEVLGGLVTNDVVQLAVGAGQYAAALTPKGKVLADVRLLRVAEELLLVDCPERAGAGFLSMIRKYVNPRLSRHVDVTATTVCIGVYGPAAPSHVEALARALGGGAPSALPELPYGVSTLATGEGPVWIVRSPDLGLPGWDVIAPASLAARLDELLAALPVADDVVAELARLEAGRPAWGVDMDDGTIPQEAGLERLDAISFDKGCYTGQEVVARLHFRGHVNRRLCRVAADGREPIPSGASLVDAAGKVVGDVRTSGVSPRAGAIAIAMLRREVEPGATVTLAEGGRALTVG